MTISPLCQVRNGDAPFVDTLNGVNVSPGNMISIRLATLEGVSKWFLEVIGTDETSTVPVLTGVNSTTHQVTTPSTVVSFNVPNDAGKAYLFQSMVVAGTNPPIQTTFAIFLPTRSGGRVVATGQTREGNANSGWSDAVNPILRNGASQIFFDDTQTSPHTGSDNLQGAIDFLKQNGGGGSPQDRLYGALIGSPGSSLQPNQVLSTRGGSSPGPMAYDSSTGTLYILRSGSKDFVAFNAQNNTISIIPAVKSATYLGPDSSQWSHDAIFAGGFIFTVGIPTGDIHRISPDGSITVIPTGYSGLFYRFSFDGNHVWLMVGSLTNSALIRIDPAAGTFSTFPFASTKVPTIQVFAAGSIWAGVVTVGDNGPTQLDLYQFDLTGTNTAIVNVPHPEAILSMMWVPTGPGPSGRLVFGIPSSSIFGLYDLDPPYTMFTGVMGDNMIGMFFDGTYGWITTDENKLMQIAGLDGNPNPIMQWSAPSGGHYQSYVQAIDMGGGDFDIVTTLKSEGALDSADFYRAGSKSYFDTKLMLGGIVDYTRPPPVEMNGDVIGMSHDSTLGSIQRVPLQPLDSRTPDNSVLTYGTLFFGYSLGQMAYDGQFIWIADKGLALSDTSYLYRYDPQKGTKSTVQIEGANNAWFLSANNDYVFVCGQGSGTQVYIVSKVSLQIVGILDINDSGNPSNPDGIFAFAVSADPDQKTVWVLGSTDGRTIPSASKVLQYNIQAAIDSYPTPWTPTLGLVQFSNESLTGLLATGGKVWVGSRATGDVYRIDVPMLNHTSTGPLDGGGPASFWQAFGSIWGISGDRINRIDPDTLSVTTILNNYPLQNGTMLFATDNGTSLIVSGHSDDGTVYQFTTDPGNEGIVYDGLLPVTQEGTFPPSVSIFGSPASSIRGGPPSIIITITTPGGFGVAQFKWSVDGGATWTMNVPVSSSVVLGSSGLTVSFENSDYYADNNYTTSPTVVQTDGSDNHSGVVYVPGTGVFTCVDGPGLPITIGLRQLNSNGLSLSYNKSINATPVIGFRTNAIIGGDIGQNKFTNQPIVVGLFGTPLSSSVASATPNQALVWNGSEWGPQPFVTVYTLESGNVPAGLSQKLLRTDNGSADIPLDAGFSYMARMRMVFGEAGTQATSFFERIHLFYVAGDGTVSLLGSGTYIQDVQQLPPGSSLLGAFTAPITPATLWVTAMNGSASGQQVRAWVEILRTPSPS